MTGTGTDLTVSHVADSYRRYPGEIVTFYTRVQVGRAVPGFTLRITVPPGLDLDDYRVLGDADAEHAVPLITWDEGANHLFWDVDRQVAPAARYEYQVQARVAPAQQGRVCESRAVVTSEGADGVLARDEEAVAIAVMAKGRYVQYLPAIYEDDDLMGRFLMLFESFWAPIEGQIDSLPFYLDPRTTPSEFLPWLASWLDLVLDERWPEQKRRQLIRSAASLYRKRGTRQGLLEYLQIYTGQRAEIVEHRAHNLRLGAEARLGPAIALGTANVPHSFTVTLRLPPAPSSGGKKERDQQELARRRRIEAIIQAEKPAHTAYDLRLEIDAELAERET
jgi:phage tail-like protein